MPRVHGSTRDAVWLHCKWPPALSPAVGRMCCKRWCTPWVHQPPTLSMEPWRCGWPGSHAAQRAARMCELPTQAQVTRLGSVARCPECGAQARRQQPPALRAAAALAGAAPRYSSGVCARGTPALVRVAPVCGGNGGKEGPTADNNSRRCASQAAHGTLKFGAAWAIILKTTGDFQGQAFIRHGCSQGARAAGSAQC